MDAIFFPRNDYPNNIEVCAHRLGKKMTYTEQTDGVIYNVSYPQFTSMAKTRGIKVGCFLNITDPTLTSEVRQVIKSDSDNGDVWFDEYSMTEMLREKISNRETITPAEFIESYDGYLLPYFIELFERKPVALSYAYGNESFSLGTIEKYLCARNSGYNSDTDYGVGYGSPNNLPYSKNRYKSKQGTIRWYDAAKTAGNDFDGQLDNVSSLIDTTLINGGWMNNFTHWHNYWQDGNEEWVEEYLDLLAQKNANSEIYFAGYGEAVAYLVYRSMISKAVMYSPVGAENKKLIIRIEAKNVFDTDTDLLQVPISIKFSTTGTPLAGQTIRCDYNLVSLGNNQYIVEIPYSEYAGAVIEKVN